MSEHRVNGTSETRVTGRVKWFNNKRGFGFVTALTGEPLGVDVFAHHSAITTSNEQFLYLVQGEYVDFVMKPATSAVSSQVSGGDETVPRWEASSITGFGGGKLMCETRHESRGERRAHFDEARVEANEHRVSRNYSAGRGRGGKRVVSNSTNR
jgi:cold shock CspA family protein